MHANERKSFAADKAGSDEIVIHAPDVFEGDAFGAHRFAFADVGAASEAFLIHARDHAQGALIAFGLALREQA
jgi:hypothetical protein